MQDTANKATRCWEAKQFAFELGEHTDSKHLLLGITSESREMRSTKLLHVYAKLHQKWQELELRLLLWQPFPEAT